MVGVVGARQLDAVDVTEELGVVGGDARARSEDLVEALELANAHRRRDVAQAVVEAETDMLEPAAGIASTLVAE